MPVYNASKYIVESITSILDQTFEDFEFLIINDGSTDDTLKKIKLFADSRIHILNHKKNKGLIKSLNEGIKKSKGKYIARMDADDISHPLRLQKQVQYMEKKHDIGICGTWIKNFGDANYVWQTPGDPDELNASLFFESMVAHPSVIMRKEFVQRHNIHYRQRYKYIEDYMLWIDGSEKFDISNLELAILNPLKIVFSILLSFAIIAMPIAPISSQYFGTIIL